MFCSKCGKEISDNVRFCPSCGEKIDEVKHGISLKKETEEVKHGISLKKEMDESALDNSNNTSNTQAIDITNYYGEYHFKSQAKGKGVDVGPITLVEGYSTKTDITVDSKILKYTQSRRFGKDKQGQINIASIRSIESGTYFSLWILILFALIAGICAFTPIVVGTDIVLRAVIAAIILLGLLFEIRNIRTIIIQSGGKFFFDSRNRKDVNIFIEDMTSHPQFKGKIKKSLFPIQKMAIIALLVCTGVMVLNPNPFASSQLFEGTYQEWEAAHYPDNYRTYIIADVTLGMEDTENDSILVAAGDSFDKEIWITNNKGQKIKDWTWLHEGTPFEGNYAIFEVTLTPYRNDEIYTAEESFVYADPMAITYDQYVARMGGINDSEVETISSEIDNNNNIEETTPVADDIVSANEISNENVNDYPADNQGDYLNYWDWCGSYEGGWMDTSLWFGLYSDGTQDPECGYIELNFRGNEFRGDLFYLGGNKFYCDMVYASSTEKYYLYAGMAGGKCTLEIYNADESYECTYTMDVSYEEYVENEYQSSLNGEYIVYGSDSGYFDRSYFESFTNDELRLARNEIFARHGRTFKDQKLQDYFNSKSWYTPRYSPEEFDSKMDQILNVWEKSNVETIKQVEASRK
ncbi:YARHG domain-containing protein [Butyrivibrio sp. AC2005]|uniref:YARHG domain-containing protein n=1 Tax=Butyrivibrio sp. AC2005 TaxID=1280672 RepID=UPI00040A4E4E|nr:YARHG domain-containing protein [Butyrivibrio sp. AC2005]